MVEKELTLQQKTETLYTGTVKEDWYIFCN
jgi:hypothetical protein